MESVESSTNKTLQIKNGALNTSEIISLWESEAKRKNCGAFSVFVGIVRDENDTKNTNNKANENSDKSGFSALSFDIYAPLLGAWFQSWQNRAQNQNATIFMAHSKGDVKIGESSFVCAIISPNRKAALDLYEKFIEDFKQNAPIWKYDIINNERIYALERSKKMNGAGILYDENNKF